jgi:glycolate oxidase
MEKAISQERQAFYQKLNEIAGPHNVLTDNQATAPYEIDGFVPETVVFPATTKQVAQIIKTANEFRTPVIPWGSGSKQQVGPFLSATDTMLCLKNMNRIVDFDASNFTVQVEAGMVNGELQKQLAEHKLFFPLDPLYLETSTIGGEVATNATGPLRFMYGVTRDLVLGVTVVTPTGDIIHTGGKTMKNVAGIDLCKMYIGSWGTLGVITEAVLRLFPLPEVSKSLHLTFANYEDAFRLVAQLLNSVLTPSSIELIDWVAGRSFGGAPHSHPEEDEVLLMVDIDGDNQAVARHEKEIKILAEANKARNKATLEGKEAAQARNAYRDVHQSILSSAPSTIQGKASVPIGKLVDMFKAAKEVGSRHKVEIGIRTHCGNGILYPYVTAENDELARIISDLRQAAVSLGGFLTVEAAPLWVRKKVEVLPQRNDYPLMKRLKTEFDPNNILNPGRAVGGIY